MAADLRLTPLSLLPQADHVNPWDVVLILQDGITKIAPASLFGGSGGTGGSGSVRLSVDTPSAEYAILPSRMVDKFVIRSSVDGTFSVSKTEGDFDVFEGYDLTAGVWSVQNIDIFGGDDGQSIFFEGLTGHVDIILFLRS